MTVRNYTNVGYWLQRDVVNIVGRFVANGASAITNNATNIIGMGFSVSRAGVGLYNIVFSEKYQLFLMATLTPLVATASVRTMQIVSWTLATKTLVVRCVDGAGAAVDLAAADGLAFDVAFARTLQKPTFGV